MASLVYERENRVVAIAVRTCPRAIPLAMIHMRKSMGPLHDPVTWYKIIYTGEQVAQWDFQNNATRTSSPGPAFVLEVPLRNLLTSIYNFVPCDWVVQRAHSWVSFSSLIWVWDSAWRPSAAGAPLETCGLLHFYIIT